MEEERSENIEDVRKEEKPKRKPKISEMNGKR
jgi:hypothetical protein